VHKPSVGETVGKNGFEGKIGKEEVPKGGASEGWEDKNGGDFRLRGSVLQKNLRLGSMGIGG